jgi:hypothetical protein
MKRQRFAAVAVATLLILSVTLSGVGAVAAQEDSDEEGEEGLFSQLLTDDGGVFSTVLDSLLGAVTEVQKVVAEHTSESQGNASTLASDFQTTFNENNQTLIDYANQRATVPDDTDLVRFQFTDRDGGTETVYLDAEIDSNGNFTSAEVISSEVFDERGYSDSDVDGYVELDWYGSERIDEELQSFVNDYAEPNQNMSTTEQIRLLSQYGGAYDTDLR